MKILIAASDPYPHYIGGKSTHILALTDGLRVLGHEVKVVSEADLSPSSRLLIRGGPRLLIKRALGLWGRDWATLWQYRLKRHLLAAAFYHRLEMEHFDVVSCQDVMMQNILSSYPGMARTILTVHGDRTNELVSVGALRRGSRAERWFLMEEKQGYCSADQIITVDSRLRAHVLEVANGAICPKRVHILYNFVNVERFRPVRPDETAERRRWHFGADDLVILCPRRLTAKNGVIYAVKAMVPLGERLEQCRPLMLLLAGDGPERRNIEDVIRQYRLEGSVRLLGDVPHGEMPSLYRVVDATLIPSVSSAGVVEATSIAALESMASGGPVIASAIGGLAEIITHRRTGLLVPQKDPLAIAEAIVLLTHDQELRESIVAKARQFVTERHSHLAAARTFVSLCTDSQQGGL